MIISIIYITNQLFRINITLSIIITFRVKVTSRISDHACRLLINRRVVRLRVKLRGGAAATARSRIFAIAGIW